MEKVKISISGHDFYLKSEDPNRMYETAENLQKRIDKLSAMAASMSLTDIVMLAALDIADENYDNRNVVIKAQQLSQEIQAKSLACEKRAEELEKQLSESDTELASLRITASEAQSELSDKFNLKNFHQYILDMGPVQFDILFNNLDAWIKKEK